MSEKFLGIPQFCSELWSQNENAKWAEVLEKVNSGQEKVTRIPFFAMKLIVKSFNFVEHAEI